MRVQGPQGIVTNCHSWSHSPSIAWPQRWSHLIWKKNLSALRASFGFILPVQLHHLRSRFRPPPHFLLRLIISRSRRFNWLSCRCQVMPHSMQLTRWDLFILGLFLMPSLLGKVVVNKSCNWGWATPYSCVDFSRTLSRYRHGMPSKSDWPRPWLKCAPSSKSNR